MGRCDAVNRFGLVTYQATEAWTAKTVARPDRPVERRIAMRTGLTIEDLGDLLELPLLAILATYRTDGTVMLSPVWHEWRDGGFNVWAGGSNEGKVRHLQRGSPREPRRCRECAAVPRGGSLPGERGCRRMASTTSFAEPRPATLPPRQPTPTCRRLQGAAAGHPAHSGPHPRLGTSRTTPARPGPRPNRRAPAFISSDMGRQRIRRALHLLGTPA